MTTILWIIFGIIVILILWVITAFNSLIVLKNRTKEALSDIDVQTKRRYDLIPNLVETVKGYATHEKELFENSNRQTRRPQQKRFWRRAIVRGLWKINSC